MVGLVEEIQRDAFDQTVRISSLLRRAKAAASKLNLPPTEKWVEQELNGYPGGAQLPAYRELSGSPKALNPFHGWIPIILNNDELDRMLSTCPIRQSVASIESVLENNETSFVQFPLPPGMIAHLNGLMDVNFGTMAVHVSTGQVHGLLDAVRNAVLEWALKLERAGISGEGMTFNREEKKIASASTTFNIGTIGSMIGNLGSNNTSGDINASAISIEQVKSLADQLAPHTKSLKADGADGPLLDKALGEIATQTKSSGTDQSKLRSSLTDLRNALSGAAGNIIASGALVAIAKLFGG